uniref:Uncharacterized protein n=1 Tax=Rhizophora mucronata TaxID=61149 RepID=A0A2P2Q717_RHIMU
MLFSGELLALAFLKYWIHQALCFVHLKIVFPSFLLISIQLHFVQSNLTECREG